MTRKYSLAYNTGKGWQERWFNTADGRRAFMNHLLVAHGTDLELASRPPKEPSECKRCGLGNSRSTCKLFKNGDCVVFLSEREAL